MLRGTQKNKKSLRPAWDEGINPRGSTQIQPQKRGSLAANNGATRNALLSRACRSSVHSRRVPGKSLSGGFQPATTILCDRGSYTRVPVSDLGMEDGLIEMGG